MSQNFPKTSPKRVEPFRMANSYMYNAAEVPTTPPELRERAISFLGLKLHVITINCHPHPGTDPDQ